MRVCGGLAFLASTRPYVATSIGARLFQPLNPIRICRVLPGRIEYKDARFGLGEIML